MDKGLNPVIQGRSPEVTVLMSCFNASRWLHEGIDSVLRQSFIDFEFILVDDGSTDETWDIIQAYREREQRIIAIKKSNTGLADSLNVGIARARGAWIARLDADDLWEADCLADRVRFVHKNPEVVLLGAGFVEIDEQGHGIKKHVYPYSHHNLVRHLRRLKRFFPHSSAFFKREIAQDLGSYNPFFRKSQDRDLWLRFAERGKIACLNNCLVRVRKYPGQITNSPVGTPQLVYGTAASTCHFLRIGGCLDPSSGRDEVGWKRFLEWIERRLIEAGVFEKRKAWADARGEYFTAENGLNGVLQFGTRLLKSNYAGALVWEKFFGSLLPEHLAREWMERSCAVS